MRSRRIKIREIKFYQERKNMHQKMIGFGSFREKL